MAIKVLVGADPEMFVKQDGVYKSGFGLIKGDKNDPFKVDKGAVQVDGMALEFNIDPAHSEQEFITNLETVMGIMRKMVPDYEVVADPVAYFTREYMQQQHPKALELGCDPDYNAWAASVNVKPNVDLPFRTGAGHVHIGVVNNVDPSNQQFFNTCCDAVKEMDFHLGLPSLLFDNDIKRREMYGKAGAFRPKSYGFEYRTLSNAWLRDSSLMSWVYKASQSAMESFFAGKKLAKKYGDIQEIINKSDKDAAMKIIRAESILVPQGL